MVWWRWRCLLLIILPILCHRLLLFIMFNVIFDWAHSEIAACRGRCGSRYPSWPDLTRPSRRWWNERCTNSEANIEFVMSLYIQVEWPSLVWLWWSVCLLHHTTELRYIFVEYRNDLLNGEAHSFVIAQTIFALFLFLALISD